MFGFRNPATDHRHRLSQESEWIKVERLREAQNFQSSLNTEALRLARAAFSASLARP